MTYSSFYARFYNLIEKISNAFSEVFSYKSSLVYSGLLIFWQLILWAQALLIRKTLSGNIVVLHYNIDFGIDLVAPSADIYFYPAIGLGVILLNLLFLTILSRHKNLSILIHYLLGGALVFSLFLSLVLLSIYLINFR